MRDSERVLNGLSKHSPQVSYKFERLYRILFNEEMFHVAYQRIYAKEGNMTEGSDGKTIDGMNLVRIANLIDLLRKETYQPQPARRVYIPKKNGKMRPLGIPSFDDKLVQEVVRMILEAIYEGQFENCSHGFRPKRSCHTALTNIHKTFTGTKWFIEGDIKGFFDNINHEILIGILAERISDDRFLRLIRKFLKAGYLEEWTFHNTFSGTPQGGIISPILANIYLDRLDKYMVEYIQRFDKGRIRKPYEGRRELDGQKKAAMKKLKTVKDESERKEIVNQLKVIDKTRLQIPSSDEMDDGYKRLKYIRYADDFLIGVIGSKEDSKKIKEDIKNFLETQLKLELSDEKTLITHSKKAAKFLGYEVLVNRSNLARRDASGRLIRVYTKKCNSEFLWIPLRRSCSTSVCWKSKRTTVKSNGNRGKTGNAFITMIWKPCKSTTILLGDSTITMRLRTTVLCSTLTSTLCSTVCIRRLRANTGVVSPKLPESINRTDYLRCSMKQARAKSENRSFTTKVSHEESL